MAPASPVWSLRRWCMPSSAMLYIAAMLGHIYIGTLGMEGALRGDGEGTVDRQLGQRTPQSLAGGRKSAWVRLELKANPMAARPAE